jgi:hypothetical protein
MTKTFHTNRDPGDEDDYFDLFLQRLDALLKKDPTPPKGKNYYLVPDENGCLSISTTPEIDRT